MDLAQQKQAIIDRLVGVPPDSQPPLSAFEEPWRTIYRRVQRATDYGDAEIMLYDAARPLEDGHWLARELVSLLPPDDAFTAYPSLYEVSARFSSVDWLWPSWLPRGLVTLLGAAPGTGKSLFALDLARRLIHGHPFPDGAANPCPGCNILIVDAEGTPALLNQRAKARDLDRRRLFLLSAPETGLLVDLTSPAHQELLLDMCRTLQPALVVVDSLSAATSRGETSLEGARALLGFLGSVASEYNPALLVIHHLRRRARSGTTSAARPAADDLRGSSHLSAAARSALALSITGPALPSALPPRAQAQEPAAQDSNLLPFPRRLEVVKTNLCLPPPPLAVWFDPHTPAAPLLRYTPLASSPRPSVGDRPGAPTRTDLCARWLLDYLAAAAQPVKPMEVLSAARQAGFLRTTLYRARQALDTLVVDVGHSPCDPHKRWALAPRPPSQPQHPPQGREGGTVGG